MAAAIEPEEPLPMGDKNNDTGILFTDLTNLAIYPPRGGQGPSVNACLAHLKLLHAFQALKEDVGYTDGLWSIWNSRANDQREKLFEQTSSPAITAEDKKKASLSRIREKRWALFIARAVDRYEAWWDTFPKKTLTEEHMTQKNSWYGKFTIGGKHVPWEKDMMPPLDVLMAMHSHILNPRSFLEDTIRNGLVDFWTTGMPWQAINDALDINFNYEVSENSQANWVSRTGRQWANLEDPLTKWLSCPFCETSYEHPWTTCGLDEKAELQPPLPGLIGHGYGDGDFRYVCQTCGKTISKKTLSVAKFVTDATALIMCSSPMPGTILDPRSGRPEIIPSQNYSGLFARTFPNRLIKLALQPQIVKLMHRGNKSAPPTMETVRTMIEKALHDEETVRRIDSFTSHLRRHVVQPTARACIRKMMNRYWENFSPFSLDLCGAIMRQGIFTGKMYELDWLHSPDARSIAERLIERYLRFLRISELHRNQLVVPTLDIDLAWHTHQLSPGSYYANTVGQMGRFVDHNDKIIESTLSDAFEWTAQVYEDMYDEIYSKCTCWYCEAIRLPKKKTKKIGKIARLFGPSHAKNMANSFYISQAARSCPDISVHISAHNAVKSIETGEHSKITKQLRARHDEKLEQNYQKAVKRAEKMGRTLPPRAQYYDHWGYSYYVYGPYIHPIYLSPGLYSGCDPGYTQSGNGAWANCASGTCGSQGGCGNSNTGACGGSNGGGCGGGGCGGGGGGGGQ